MMIDCSKDEFLRDYSEAVKNASAALFIGSGLSRATNAYDWKGLLRESAQDIGLNVDKESDLISLAQYYVNNKKRQKIDEAISKCFKDVIIPTENHLLLASMPIYSYWTTNYDKLIEKAFEHFNASTMVLTDDNSLKQFTDGKDVIIHKLHGDVARPQECVITKHDYEEFAYKHEILLSQLKGEMCAKTFLFLGYSFSDTDINHILTRIRLFYKNEPPKRHFCILKRVSTDDAYGAIKQEHVMRDLIEYGILTVLVNEYSEITDMLKEIRHRIYSKNVFLSGSYEDSQVAHEYGKYLRVLSEWLIANGFQIYTGYGRNAGAEIVAGAFKGDQNTSQSIKKFIDAVHLFPFPYKKDLDEKSRRTLYAELRKNAILNTHITIIVNGSKWDEYRESTINSNGVLDEARISIEQGNLVIPIGVTDGAAKQIWTEMSTDGSAYTLSSPFQNLNIGATFSEVVAAVKEIINEYGNHKK